MNLRKILNGTKSKLSKRLKTARKEQFYRSFVQKVNAFIPNDVQKCIFTAHKNISISLDV